MNSHNSSSPFFDSHNILYEEVHFLRDFVLNKVTKQTLLHNEKVLYIAHISCVVFDNNVIYENNAFPKLQI
jgi:hypothetical protein